MAKGNEMLHIGSLNVRGLNKASKRLSVFNWIRQKQFHVMFLQECYSSQDTENIWKNEWGGQVIFSHGSKHSKGTIVLISKGFEAELIETKTDNNGRYVIVKLTVGVVQYTCVNIYAPNETSEKKLFFENLYKQLISMKIDQEDNIIIGGDWNTVLNGKIDKKGGRDLLSENVVTEMNNLISELDLEDIWRIKNPLTERFTYRQKTPLIQSRLDYFMTSSKLHDTVTSTKILSSYCSDHSCISMSISHIDGCRRGNGYWKFNASLLDDKTYVTELKHKLKDWSAQHGTIDDKRVAWDIIKYEIRKHAIAYSSKKKKVQNAVENDFLKQLNSVEIKLGNNHTDENMLEYEYIKNRLNEIEINKGKGAIIRSRAKWVENGEKPTRYFFDLEKRNSIKKHIRKLKLPCGIETTNPEEILEYERTFYSNLYTSRKIKSSPHKKDFFKNNSIPELSANDRAFCEAEITLEECKEVLKTFSNNKSPGNDGLTIEFYQTFWDDICKDFFNCIQYSYIHGEMSVSQRQAVITLLEKEGKDRNLLKNWRPISLLNLDYKIMTKVLVSKIQQVLPTIISPNQSVCVKNRFIGDAIRTIQDIMHYTDLKNISGIILFLDFEKAFDSVEWNFLFKALERFNFGPKFIKWIKMTCTNISSCIINNGHTSKYFKVSRGVRQGDPLSSYLFIIVVEFLAIAIRSDKNIHGIKVDNHEIKLCQYSDDTTVTVKDTHSAKQTISILKQFEHCSGLKINLEKTQGMWLGSNKNSEDTPFNISWPKDPIKALGIFFSYDTNKAIKANIDDKMERLKKQLLYKVKVQAMYEVLLKKELLQHFKDQKIVFMKWQQYITRGGY